LYFNIIYCYFVTFILRFIRSLKFLDEIKLQHHHIEKFNVIFLDIKIDRELTLDCSLTDNDRGIAPDKYWQLTKMTSLLLRKIALKSLVMILVVHENSDLWMIVTIIEIKEIVDFKSNNLYIYQVQVYIYREPPCQTL